MNQESKMEFSLGKEQEELKQCTYSLQSSHDMDIDDPHIHEK